MLLHISSLLSGYGIGNFGKSAYRFVDMLKSGGFSLWQVLPFCMPDGYNSPYRSRASFSTNPYFIDIDLLDLGELRYLNTLFARIPNQTKKI